MRNTDHTSSQDETKEKAEEKEKEKKEKEKKEKEKKEKEVKPHTLKSNNPHLTGGEKPIRPRENKKEQNPTDYVRSRVSHKAIVPRVLFFVFSRFMPLLMKNQKTSRQKLHKLCGAKG